MSDEDEFLTYEQIRKRAGLYHVWSHDGEEDRGSYVLITRYMNPPPAGFLRDLANEDERANCITGAVFIPGDEHPTEGFIDLDSEEVRAQPVWGIRRSKFKPATSYKLLLALK